MIPKLMVTFVIYIYSTHAHKQKFLANLNQAHQIGLLIYSVYEGEQVYG